MSADQRAYTEESRQKTRAQARLLEICPIRRGLIQPPSAAAFPSGISGLRSRVYPSHVRAKPALLHVCLRHTYRLAGSASAQLGQLSMVCLGDPSPTPPDAYVRKKNRGVFNVYLSPTRPSNRSFSFSLALPPCPPLFLGFALLSQPNRRGLLQNGLEI